MTAVSAPAEHDGALRERTSLLLALTTQLATALSIEDVGRVVVQTLGSVLGARSIGLWQLAGDRAVLVQALNYSAEMRELVASLPLDADMPLAEAMRSGDAGWYASREEYAQRYPAAERHTRIATKSGALAFACLPLVVHDRAIGGLAIAFDDDAKLGEDDRGFLLVVTGHAAHALERVRLFEAERRARDRSLRLQRLTAALSPVVTVEDVARVVIHETMFTFGATVGGVWLEDPGQRVLDCVDLRGSAIGGRFQSIALDAPVPASVAAKLGVPVFVSSLEELDRDYAEVAGILRGAGITVYSIAAVPLFVGERRGVLTLSFIDGRTLDEDERPLLEAMAQQASIAMQRAVLFENEARAHERHRLLAEASAILGSTLDFDETLRNVVRLVVPRLADFAFFDVRDGHSVTRTSLARDPAKQAILDGSRWMPSERTDVNLCALSTGSVGFHARIDEAFRRMMASSPEHLAVLEQLELSAMMTLPLYSRGRLLAALTLCMGESRRPYTSDALDAASELMRRAAMALDNVMLHRDLQLSIRARDEFLSIASHELNTPLTALSLSVDRVRRDPALAAPSRVAVDRAARQTDRLAKLVSQLLDVSRLQTGHLSVQPAEVDLALAVREAVGRLDDERQRAGSRIALDVPDAVVGQWDALRVDQVVTNLVTNALKYGRGEPIEVRLVADEAHARLSVRDHGIGIAEHDLARIFERFERAVPTRNFGGFGLGLWITRQIVEASGGSIAVESSVGAGSCFSVVLPRQPSATPDAESRRTPHPSPHE